MDVNMQSLDDLIKRDKKLGKPLRKPNLRGGALPGKGRGGKTNAARAVPKQNAPNKIQKQQQNKQGQTNNQQKARNNRPAQQMRQANNQQQRPVAANRRQKLAQLKNKRAQ